MADNIEHQDKGELVANCDQLQNDEVVVTTPDRKSTRLNSSHPSRSRMPSSA